MRALGYEEQLSNNGQYLRARAGLRARGSRLKVCWRGPPLSHRESSVLCPPGDAGRSVKCLGRSVKCLGQPWRTQARK